MVLDDDHHHVHMDLQELPEGCIANVVSLTTPRDACRFEEVPELIVVWWLDIRGKNDTWIELSHTKLPEMLANVFLHNDHSRATRDHNRAPHSKIFTLFFPNNCTK
ncbi:hypothetical protein C1H46_025719 [Malus baccata]|uniref:Uncharacterized protein n=1 Tax=Malus baccata TaxID=106549 RepID=A0A540LQN2_MALBA|nr:hypothetical protein C1H46_025719 [Malus baccata]